MNNNHMCPLVSIIVVNHNGQKYLNDCLFSLFDLNYPKEKLEIIMIDNCSSDESVDFVREKFPEVKIIANDKNNYCRANNLGIRHARGEWVGFVNNDVLVDKDWLSELIAGINGDVRVSGVGGKILLKDKRIQSAGHEEYPHFYWGDRGFMHEDRGQYNSVEEVSSICGAAALFKKTCLEEVGLFDEDFEMYLDDVDLCLRMQKKKMKILYLPKSVAHHHFRGTSDSASVVYFSERNRLFLVAKHFPDRLGEALYGKGYFACEWDGNHKGNIFNILHLVFLKLFENNNREFAWRIVPGVFNNLKKIIDLENSIMVARCQLLQEEVRSFTEESRSHQKTFEEKNILLADARRTVELLNKEIQKLFQENQAHETALRQKEAIIEEKNILLADARRTVELLNKEIQKLSQENQAHETALNEMTTKLNNTREALREKTSMIERLSGENMVLKNDLEAMARLDIKKKFLVIKPQRIDGKIVETVVRALKRKHPNSSVSLLANFTQEDYSRFAQNPNVDQRLFFIQEKNHLTFRKIPGLLFQFWFARFDAAIVLLSRARETKYAGYRKARLLGLLSGSKKIHFYYVD